LQELAEPLHDYLAHGNDETLQGGFLDMARDLLAAYTAKVRADALRTAKVWADALRDARDNLWTKLKNERALVENKYAAWARETAEKNAEIGRLRGGMEAVRKRSEEVAGELVQRVLSGWYGVGFTRDVGSLCGATTAVHAKMNEIIGEEVSDG
jgi:hypothetical protein